MKKSNNMKINKNSDLQTIYDKVHSSDEQFFTYPPIKESFEIFKELDSWKGLNVLEIGCGPGHLAAMIASAGASEVLACDYSESSIKQASSNYQMDNLTFIHQDINNFNTDNKFDVVVLQGVLEHLDEPFTSLKYFINKFMKPDGKLINSCPSFYNPRGYVWMTLSLLFDVPMSLTDLHFLDIEDFKRFSSENNLNLTWTSIHQDWGSGLGMIKDYEKRLVNALEDANMPNNKVNKLLKWLEESSKYFVNTDDTGAIVIYTLYKNEKD
tara:strand:+ start:685 stop:1488 length:804 start_codon:yes stop_codon:yes gene_type:complete